MAGVEGPPVFGVEGPPAAGVEGPSVAGVEGPPVAGVEGPPVAGMGGAGFAIRTPSGAAPGCCSQAIELQRLIFKRRTSTCAAASSDANSLF